MIPCTILSRLLVWYGRLVLLQLRCHYLLANNFDGCETVSCSCAVGCEGAAADAEAALISWVDGT